MKYVIKITNPGSHFCNPLLALEDQEFATRDEACEAIFARMYDVIDGVDGCEMIDCPDWSKFGEDDDEAYNEAKNKYIAECRDCIYSDGYASHDGVSASVEEAE